ADMEVHYRVHTGEKPYRCKYDHCAKCFARRSDLLSHERTHTGSKPFMCAFPGCERSFARKFDLHKHQRMHEGHTDVCGTATTKKRKLVPTSAVKTLSSDEESCDCPRDIGAAFGGGRDEIAADADVLLPEPMAPRPVALPSTNDCSGGRGTAPACASVCLDAPTRPLRFELRCTEDHVHSPPACFAAFSSLDMFLSSHDVLELCHPMALDASSTLHRPSTTMAMSCCPAHLELRPPPPEDEVNLSAATSPPEPGMLDQLFASFSAPSSSSLSASGTAAGSMSDTLPGLSSTGPGDVPPSATPIAMCEAVSNPSPTDILPIPPSSSSLSDLGVAIASMNPSLLVSSSASVAPTASLFVTPSTSAVTPMSFAPPAGVLTKIETPGATSDSSSSSALPLPPPAAIGGLKKAFPERTCLPTPALQDYSRHNRSCGHLSIQHGNHRDYVVQNHLVCLDSVKCLGAHQSGPANDNAEPKTPVAPPRRCAPPEDPHRPGCGHLPVRHKDHIDYVVEDNLFCQQTGWLEGNGGDDNLELLGDDFWDFYGAIDAFPTD
ncbi:hypothetical protein BBJ28_00020332, partial [Nothophytophthora sp. Chile5]